MYAATSSMAIILVVVACGTAKAQRFDAEPTRGEFVHEHCLQCHDRATRVGELDLESLLEQDMSEHIEVWERVVRKLAARQMPPLDEPRPSDVDRSRFLHTLTATLDAIAVENPHPGSTETIRRLNRTEYQYAIRDLLDLNLDVGDLLPADESSHGFDNITVASLSPTLLDRYISAAQQISRLALGGATRAPQSDTIRVPADRTQEKHLAGLPFGTRGGTVIPYTFSRDGEYEVQIRLSRDRNEHVEGLHGKHELELFLDREAVAHFLVEPPKDRQDHQLVDAHLKVRIPFVAGPHQLGVAFVRESASLTETMRQPFEARFNMHRHPRTAPAVFQVSITGPVSVSSTANSPSVTPTRKRILLRTPTSLEDEEACAEEILSTLMQRAYRRRVTRDDLRVPLNFFRDAISRDAPHSNDALSPPDRFERGLESALSAILVNPNFLFHIQPQPTDVAPDTTYTLDDVALASRLSFFLWSSIPDDELLDLAFRNELHHPDTLHTQVRRMLSDARSQALVTNFAAQWLYLRNLDSTTPDVRLFPDFDDNLRQAFRVETELFVESIVREDRSVLELLRSDYTFLNERLAKHYQIPHIYGSQFRRITLTPADHRGGLLRHGSILTVTSYATRTSPVIRGHWILKNLLGSAPPPPPPNVPALSDNTVSGALSVRDRLAEHRANQVCASCHNLMDPVGFALENFDAVGRWREEEAGAPVDVSGSVPGSETFQGVTGLEEALLRNPELFVSTLAEKLLTYALGRGIETFDAAAIRKIVRDSAPDNYRFSSLVHGIVTSVPFQKRRSQ